MRLWEEDRTAFGAFDTIYFGGGTPSLLTPEQLGRILEAAHDSLGAAGDAWIFLEANPEDVTPESVRAWRDLGIRTLSLGVQSFDAATLAFLGRRHSADEARRSVELALDAGFSTVSIDLIYGTPDEPIATWRRTLAEAVRLGPQHLSCYQLTIHEGTPFGFRLARGKLAELPETAQAELFLLTHSWLGEHGYPAYEVSNFARSPEHRSRHNRKYWDHTPYLGLGPSAHSFSGRRRWWNERKLGPYEEKVGRGEKPLAGSEELASQDLALEALLLGLRTTDGIDLARFRERYGVDLLERNGPVVEQLASAGLIRHEDGRLVPTLQGLAVADSLARSFEVG
jgi:oxygen-independent coproporphyrinogen-3 oxidase